MATILIVCSGNAPGFRFEIDQAFIYDQVKAIKKNHPEIGFEYFFVSGKGVRGYLRNLKKLKRRIVEQKIDIVHAHYGLSGLLANLQWVAPVVCTFHGSDMNLTRNRIVSALAAILSREAIYVDDKLRAKSFVKRNKAVVIPCGVDFEIFKPMDQQTARRTMNLDPSKRYLLFASSFDNKVKNYPLLREACTLLAQGNMEIVELKGYSRAQVALLMNAADVCVMTSVREGSPQFIKEAMACNCPIVATDVGDVREVLDGTEGTFICSFDAQDVADKIRRALAFGGRTNGRDRIQYLHNDAIASKVSAVYHRMRASRKIASDRRAP
jgi:glycosyltransferase involved in cell wall biosynthesis